MIELDETRDVMSALEALIVAAMVAAFAIFAGVLAWAERQTRDLPRTDSPKRPYPDEGIP
jgi:hypothetical protein